MTSETHDTSARYSSEELGLDFTVAHSKTQSAKKNSSTLEGQDNEEGGSCYLGRLANRTLDQTMWCCNVHSCLIYLIPCFTETRKNKLQQHDQGYKRMVIE
jgi:hypothetical protein